MNAVSQLADRATVAEIDIIKTELQPSPGLFTAPRRVRELPAQIP